MIAHYEQKTDFPRFLTVEETARLLGVSDARVSLWIGECKLPVAARSEYAGFLLLSWTVETVGRKLAETVPPAARLRTPSSKDIDREVSMT
jgi:hypothetical protein